MFTQFKNIDTAFSHIKRFSIGFLICCALLSGLVIWKSFSWVRESQGKIYVLAGGKAIEVFASDRKDNVAVELRDHIKMFHYWFFTLDPDEKVIQTNIAKALNLADESGRKAYENLKERGFYNNLISANISQEITVDSTQLNLDVYPFLFRCYATQKLIRSSSTVLRKLVTQGAVRNVSRSDNNAHGFLIQRWETVDNADSTQIVRP
ncbi:conjugative transposon protein TraK [Pedobacter sp. ISL-68]|uniref:conjugative transposon protein TraK n=1 Tax=unclassified Pedobacter TaxID=2628915 RepID=UPI001BEB98BF|nr:MULTISPECIES: conjugative transposon protein TraK [unclassified Pedobacter]MBT2564655.1 conjugative transposon protein TraK [Pedobacter sp. ISL-64]MBT2593654.1 conjugative transposon protein TraK [Pedobacter sp. ISL-68]